jgi:hypothetical protein
MARTIDYSTKKFTGTYHWTELADTPMTTIGNARVGTLWSIPFDKLQELGINRVETEEFIEVLCQIQEWEPYRGKQTKTCYDNYQIVKLDYEYLLEWQARLFNCLNWSSDKVAKFLQKDTLKYIDERMSYLKRREIERQAEKVAEQLGVSKEKVLAQWFPQQDVVEPVREEIATQNYLEGTLIKMSNEWFVSVGEEKDLYKVSNKQTLVDVLINQGFETNSMRGEDLIFYLNSVVKFQKKENTPPPKSRNAKGWVDSIVGINKP